jgi:catechol 2,3-dioxygenase-like lactoylglutathione lyase family enzyme
MGATLRRGQNPPVPEPTVLDHVALAVERWADAWPRYRAELGGRWVAGGGQGEFDACQLAFAGGMKVELIAPAGPGFVRRFLDGSGPGPHHLTFKVPDIVATIAAAEAAGYPAIGVAVDDPVWKEAFFHPRSAHGVLVQVAQAAGTWDGPPPADLPPAGSAEPAGLVRVAVAVPDPQAAARLFAGVLGGTEAGDGDGWVDLAWDGGGVVRLLDAGSPASGQPGPLAAWVGDRPGRVHHVAFTVGDPAAVAGAHPVGDGRWEVAPAANLGTRLVLTAG